MKHFHSHDLISAYVDDRLSPEERADVEALLQSSDEARAELDSYRKLGATLKALPTEQAPPDLMSRILAQAEQESLHGKLVAAETTPAENDTWRTRWTIPAVSAVASLALLMLVMFQIQAPQSPSGMTADSSSEMTTDSSPMELTVAANEVEGVNYADTGHTPFGHDVGNMDDHLGVSDQITILEDGTLRMISPNDISTAQVGEVINSFEVRGDGIAVVQLTVIDRQQVLDRLHVLLSNLNVPQETPESNNYGERTDDFLAVYVEADEGRLETFLSQLQQNMDVEQMFVSTAILPATLNQFVAEQGYSDLDLQPSPEMPFAGDRKLVPQQPEPRESVIPAPVQVEGENRPAAAPSPEAKKTDLAPNTSREVESFRRRIVKSELPPPPPLPQMQQSLNESLAETAPPEPALPSIAGATLEFSVQQRQVRLRLPESVGKKLIVQPRVSGQLSLSNGDALNRSIEEEEEEEDQLDQRLIDRAGRFKRPSIVFSGKGTADVTSAPQPESPQDADEKEELLAKDKSRQLKERRLRVLFVLTDDVVPVPATKPALPSATEAKQKAQN